MPRARSTFRFGVTMVTAVSHAPCGKRHYVQRMSFSPPSDGLLFRDEGTRFLSPPPHPPPSILPWFFPATADDFFRSRPCHVVVPSVATPPQHPSRRTPPRRPFISFPGPRGRTTTDLKQIALLLLFVPLYLLH